jgi:hypothetical protein
MQQPPQKGLVSLIAGTLQLWLQQNMRALCAWISTTVKSPADLSPVDGKVPAPGTTF